MRLKILKRGGYVTGSISVTGGETSFPVTLASDPVHENQASTKQYLDGKSDNISVAVFYGIISVERLPAFTGDLLKQEGSSETVIKSIGVVENSYVKANVNSKGQVIEGYNLNEDDIPNLYWEKINTDLPTTLNGYGVIDALPLIGGTMTGPLKIGNILDDNKSLVTKNYVDSLIGNTSVGTETGDIIYKLTNVTPSGFLKANGGEVSKIAYSDLYAKIGDAFTTNGDKKFAGSGKPWSCQYDFNIEQTSETINWLPVGTIPIASWFAQTLVTKNRVYLIGGENGGYPSFPYVFYATINTDGTLGEWAQGTNLPSPLFLHQLIVTKNRVYIFGGRGYNMSNAVYSAEINIDGSLGDWNTEQTLPESLFKCQAIVTKNRVYLLGGNTGSELLSITYTAPIDENGIIGVWSTGGALPEAFSETKVIATKNRIYLLGGENGQVTNKVYTAAINSDGTLGSWTEGTPLPTELKWHQVITTKHKVYMIGGINRTSYNIYQYSATINQDGTLGTWTQNPGIELTGSEVIVVKNKVYLLDGKTSSGFTDTIYCGEFQGGVNDYSPYYDGSITVLDPDYGFFGIPDIQSKLKETIAYIKY